MARPRKNPNALPDRVALAVRAFWRTRKRQDRSQGRASGRRDSGNRTAATGGKQLDGFIGLLGELLAESGISRECIFTGRRELSTIPGYFRPTKEWDLLVIAYGHLLAAIETKAHIGPSFGNNYNNRVEEALGSATDVWTAYREGIFSRSPEPFVGYLMLLEEHTKSSEPVGVAENHFGVSPEFRGASYAGRWEHSIRRMVRERCYSGAAFLLSNQRGGLKGEYREPADDLTFARFAQLCCGHTRAGFAAVSKPSS